jgi:diguanylate cyclase (GGDEF)-like protein/PAS domain S-box-containing protein
MTSSGAKLAAQTNTISDHECVLLIAADADEAARVLGELGSVTEERFQIEWVTSLSVGIDRLREGSVGAAVLDLDLPGTQGTEAFDRLSQAAFGVPILILSNADTEGVARQAVQDGAQDYLLKDQADGYRLRRTVRTMMDRCAANVVALENEVANATLDSIGEAVLRTDKLGNITYLNRLAEDLSGWSRDEALGHPTTDVLRLIDSASGAAVDNAVSTVMQQNSTASATICMIHCTLVRRDGVRFGIENRVTTVSDRAGNAIGVVMSIRDVSMARAVSLEVSRVAQHDILTNLPNRILFNDRIVQAISLAERQRKQLAVLFLDLDQFKRINDTLGHAVGDQLLRSVAMRLKACVRRSDTVCRLGGDEFLILLSQVEHVEDAGISARKILRAVAAPHIIDNRSLDISVSIGGSTYPADGLDADTLMSHADAAMYEAKLHGRNGYQFFRSDMRKRVVKRLQLEGDMRSALGRNEFMLHYQPKINLHTGQITGMEALIRWLHPQEGLLLPPVFIPIAEECGLIVPIGQWVLFEACRQSREWGDSGFGTVPVAVNVSAAEFRAKDFLSGVRAVLISTGVEPENLQLELTESVLMEDAESTVTTLRALKVMGVQVAIDDFGTGFSSFTYLQRFHVDTLKLDRSFVREITMDPKAINLVSAMINIGKSLNQRVVAEGVENRSQLNFLQRHGCDEGQGFYFSHPVVAAEAGSLFKTGLEQALVH